MAYERPILTREHAKAWLKRSAKDWADARAALKACVAERRGTGKTCYAHGEPEHEAYQSLYWAIHDMERAT